MQILLGFFLSIFALGAWAIETPDVLPKGIRSVSLKYGTVGGLNQYYSDSGQLQNLSDINTVSLDVATLETIDDEVTDLVNILNQFGPDNLGDQLFLGNLSVNAQPELSYAAPIFLYGWSDKLTLGVGIPYFTFKNSVNLTLTDSNYEAIRAQVDGASEELDAAFDRLNVNMRNEFQAELANRGFDRLASSDESFLGDVQMIAAYQINKSPKFVDAIQVYLNLPTGPKPDPDSLTDVEIFGRTSIKPMYVSLWSMGPRSFLLGSASYQYVLPSEMEKRVPLNREDQIPAANQKRTLDEKLGDTLAASVGAGWKHTDNLTTTIAYQKEQKAEDSYSQSDIGDSSLLESGTKRSADIGKIEFFYSSIEDFKKGNATIPYTASVEISSVLNGVNIENQTRLDLWFSLYF